MSIIDDYLAQVARYQKTGSLYSDLLPPRPDLRLGKQGLLDLMNEAHKQELARTADPVAYYQANPQAQGLIDVTPEMDIIDVIGGLGPKAAIFAGAKAKNAALDMLGMAKKMDIKGIDRDTIWKNTGWGRGIDGEWRFEIPDNKAVYSSKGLQEAKQDNVTYKTGKLPQGLIHQDLYENYPELADVKLIDHNFKDSGGTAGMYLRSDPTLTLWDSHIPKRKVALHEGMHGVQGIEGFATGGSEMMFKNPERLADTPLYKGWKAEQPIRDEIESIIQTPKYKAEAVESNKFFEPYGKRIQDLSSKKASIYEIDAVFNEFKTEQAARFPELGRVKMLEDSLRFPKKEPTPHEAYKSLAAEVEARNVERRADMEWYERRAKAPWRTQDVNDVRQQISPSLLFMPK